MASTRGSERTAGAGAQRILLPTPGPSIWVHAVSLGKFGGGGLVAALRDRFPQHALWFNNDGEWPETGAESVRRKDVFYFPLDFAFSIRPYLRAAASALVVMQRLIFGRIF